MRASSRPGILFPSLCCPQKDGGSSSCHRSQNPKQDASCSPFQNGNHTANSFPTPSGGLGSKTRYERCVFSHPCEGPGSALSPFRNRQHCLSVCGHVFRSFPSSTHFHQGTSVDGVIPQTVGFSHSPFPGRLAPQSFLPGRTVVEDSISPGACKSARHSHQSIKVGFDSQTDIRVSGGHFQPHSGESVPISGLSEQGLGVDPFTSLFGRNSSSVIFVPSRIAQPSVSSSPFGSTPSTSSAVVPQMLLGSSQGSIERNDSSAPSFLPSPPVVGGTVESRAGFTLASPRPADFRDFRCQSARLGGPLPFSHSSRAVDSCGINIPYQRTGNVVCDSLPGEVQGDCSGKGCVDSVGQHHCSLSHKEGRGNSFMESVSSNTETVCMVSGAGSHPEGSIYPRQAQCLGGLSEPVLSGSEIGVVSASSGVQEDTGLLPLDSGRSLCNMSQCQDECLCEPGSGRQRMGVGLSVNILGGSDRVRLSPHHSDSRGSEKDSVGRLYNSPSSSSVADAILVPHSPRSPRRRSPRASEIQETPETTSSGGLSQGFGVPKTSRVATIKQSLVERGFSAEVANRAAAHQRKSSLSLYESHFKAFIGWLSKRNCPLEQVTVPVVADYLLYLFDDKGLQASTIASHRTALSEALPKFQGFSIGSHPVLSSLLSNFGVSRAPVRNKVPDWDLSTVLSRLMGPDFEPPKWDSTTDKLRTTWKTVFLLALASAKRAGELHALSRDQSDIVFSKESVSLRTVPGFLPKNQRLLFDPKPFSVPALAPFSGRDLPDRLLCPVRMLKYYLNFTKGTSIHNRRLFVKVRGEGNVVSKTISSWLKNCIIFCHDDKFLKVKGHEVRRMSASWAFFTGVDVRDILAAGSWSSTTTFTSFYLADVQKQIDGRFRFVVASTLPAKK